MSELKTRIDDVPAYEIAPYQMDAAVYNQIKLALLRLGSPLRFRLPSLRDLDIELDNDAWVCVDRSLNDVPVLAWTDFETGHRDSLVQPLACEVRFYHAHAEKIIGRLFQDVLATIRSQISATRDAGKNLSN
jgi:hypothetical protein